MLSLDSIEMSWDSVFFSFIFTPLQLSYFLNVFFFFFVFFPFFIHFPTTKSTIFFLTDLKYFSCSFNFFHFSLFFFFFSCFHFYYFFNLSFNSFIYQFNSFSLFAAAFILSHPTIIGGGTWGKTVIIIGNGQENPSSTPW